MDLNDADEARYGEREETVYAVAEFGSAAS